MPTSGRIILLGSAAVILFDTVASLASRHFGFAYVKASVGSWLICALVGYWAMRSAGMRGVVLAAVAIALVDATVGWAISWAIGPGRLSSGRMTPAEWAAAAVTVILLSLVAASLGAVAAKLPRDGPG
jgi:hypothetical protein